MGGERAVSDNAGYKRTESVLNVSSLFGELRRGKIFLAELMAA